MGGLKDYNTAAKFKAVLDRHAKKQIDRLRPGEKYATVSSIGEYACEVVYPGEDQPVPVACGSIMPDSVGQTVRIGGPPGHRRVVDVLRAAADPSLVGDYKWSAQTTDHGNWLKCEGGAKSRTTHSALFALIGTSFGVGDGSTTFNLPDPRGRVSVSVGTGASLTSRALGASGGTETHTLTSAQMPVHTHLDATGHEHPVLGGENYVYSGGAGAAGLTIAAGGNLLPTTGGTTIALNSAGSGAAHNIMQPWLAIGSLFIHT